MPTHALRRALVLLLALLLATTGAVALNIATADDAHAARKKPTRDLLRWPFARNSIWNTPVGDRARYVPARLADANAWHGQITVDPEHLSLNPHAPVKRLHAPGQPGHGARVRVDRGLDHNGKWNGCSTLLAADNRTVWSGQPLRLSKGGNPSWRYTTQSRPVDLRGPGIEGCHGGSHMSGLGGSLRTGELNSHGPIRHALKINLFCKRFCHRGGSEAGSKRWPALTADSYWRTGYGGRVPQLKMGALLAIPKGTSLRSIKHPKARKLALALREYGGYVVDDTAWDVHALSADERMVRSGEWPGGRDRRFHAEMQRVFRMLAVVDNNGPRSIGGPGRRLAPWAPCYRGERGCR